MMQTEIKTSLEEMRAEKAQLERKIIEAIELFIDKTGVSINDVDIIRTQEKSSAGTFTGWGVKVSVDL